MNLYVVRMQAQSPDNLRKGEWDTGWYNWPPCHCFCESSDEALEMARTIVMRSEKDARPVSVEWLAGEVEGAPGFLLYKGSRDLSV